MKTGLPFFRRDAAAPGSAASWPWTVFLLTLAVILLVGCVATLPWTATVVTRLENVTGDMRLRSRGNRAPKVPIIILNIDRDTLDKPPFNKEPLMFLGKHHAVVFEKLRDFGAKAIGVDIIQPQPLEDIVSGTNPDQLEAQVLAATPQVVLNYTLNLLPNGTSLEVKPNPMLLTALALGGGGLGFANSTSDVDGVVRRYTLTDSEGGISFALAIAEKATGQEAKWDKETLQLGSRKFESDKQRQGYIDYVGPRNTFPRISYRSFLLHPELYRKQIKDSIVIIGITSADHLDYFQTPMMRDSNDYDALRGDYMDGVEVQANIVHTILAGNSIHKVGAAGTWLCIAIAAFLVLPLYGLPRVSLIVPIAMLLVVAWVWVSLVAFTRWNVMLPLVAPVAAMVVNQSALIGARLRQEYHDRKSLEDKFGRYVSPQVLEHMLRTPGAFALGGKRQTVTVIFSDIRGFTTMSETMEPEQVTRMLNTYLEAMVEIVFENGGTVDKFIGDGIMVVYNWPLEQRDHATRAVRTAVQMQRTVNEKMAEWRAMGLPEFQVGIGIHTGPAVVGNIGAARKMELTAIGDTINVASRIEGLCKTVGKEAGSSILLSDTCRNEVVAESGSSVPGEYTLVRASAAEIRGLSHAMEIYAVK